MALKYDVDYTDLLPEEPPADLVSWALTQGAFKHDEIIVFKQGWYRDRHMESSKKEKIASCTCSSCERTFIADWTSSNTYYGGNIGIVHDGEVIASGQHMLCPICGETTKLHHASFIPKGDGAAYFEYVVVPTRIEQNFLLTEYEITKTINKDGNTKFTVRGWEACLFTKNNIIRFSKHCFNMNHERYYANWHQNKKFSESIGEIDYFYPGDTTKGTCLENSKFEEYMQVAKKCQIPVSYLRLYRKKPSVENFFPVGAGEFIADAIYKELKKEHYCAERIRNSKIPVLSFINWKEKSPYKMLGLNREQMKIFVNSTMEYEKKSIFLKLLKAGLVFDKTALEYATVIKEKEIEQLVACNEPLNKVLRYLGKQIAKFKAAIDFTYLRDYWKMATAAQFSLDVEHIKYPGNLCRAHDIVTKLTENMKTVNGKQFATIYKQLLPLSYANDKYTITPAKNAKELITEGKLLKHCVGRYSPEHCKYESIFFIRKVSEPSVPFFTLQLDVFGKQIIQNRGYKNSEPFPESGQAFINEWIQNIVRPFKLNQNQKTKKAIKLAKKEIMQLTA